jgi:hypothetical protein
MSLSKHLGQNSHPASQPEDGKAGRSWLTFEMGRISDNRRYSSSCGLLGAQPAMGSHGSLMLLLAEWSRTEGSLCNENHSRR